MVLDMMKHYDVPYTVHISSSVVESVADHYSSTKRSQEKIVLEWYSDVVLRPTLMFGWFDRKHQIGFLVSCKHPFSDPQ
jgi:hypothetical protein